MDPRLGHYGLRQPFESPLEEFFARSFDKYVHDEASIDTQHEVVTRVGKFRLDFLVVSGGRRVGIECDGAQFHDAHRDEWRDAVILAEDRVDAMVRLAGSDLTRSAEGCLGLLARFEPGMFSSRGLTNLETLMLHSKLDLGDPHVETHDVYWEIDPPELGPYQRLGRARIVYRRRADMDRPKDDSPWWTRYARFAARSPSMCLEQMIGAYDEEIRRQNPGGLW